MLYLATGLARRSVPTAVAVRPGSLAAQKAREAGIEAFELPMRGECDLIAARRIARIARARGFNILHSHTAHAHALIVLASRLFRARCRTVVHRRIEFPAGRFAFGLGRLKYLRGVDAYVAVSDRVKQTLVAAGVPGWRVFVVRSSVEVARFTDEPPEPGLRSELGVPTDAFVVGSVGALVGHKDHANLLEACRTVRQAVPQAWLVIVGEGPLRGALEEQARKLGMDDRLVLTGFRWDVPRLMRAFDVFALSSSEEGMCNTLLEAAAAGRPVVTTDAGGAREAVVHEATGFVVPVRNAQALADGILRLYREPEAARRMAQKGRERVAAEFDAATLAERTMEVYGRVLCGELRPGRPTG